MIQTQALVVDKETITPAWWRLVLSAPELSPNLEPGQFVLLRCGDHFTCYLRRPIFPQQLDEQQLSLLLRPVSDPGLAWLSARKVGDPLDIIGPLGVGFALPNTVRNLLLIGDSPMISPLLGQMERAVAAGVSVTLALGGSRAALLYPAAELPPAVEFQAATLDGSLGHHGPVTDLLPDLLRWADMACAVGSAELYQSLKTVTRSVRLVFQSGFLYGLVLDQVLPCGVGACFGCPVDTTRGLKFVCIDGPVLDLAEISPGVASSD
jgi:dihydroorotate dehydrogenase electron transfer subunit